MVATLNVSEGQHESLCFVLLANERRGASGRVMVLSESSEAHWQPRRVDAPHRNSAPVAHGCNGCNRVATVCNRVATVACACNNRTGLLWLHTYRPQATVIL